MGSGSSLSTIDALLDVAPSAFQAAQDEYLVAVKQNYDNNGNLRGPLPLESIVSQHTAEWANRIDDLVRGLQQRTMRGETLIGTQGDFEADPQAQLNWTSANSRVNLRNAANTAFRDLQLGNLFFGTGPRVITRNGSPNGNEGAGAGSLCLDYSTDSGRLWVKTTSTGSSGWVQLGGGNHYETFGFDTATSSTDVWCSFGPHLIETAQTNAPRAYHVWRVPFAGSVSAVTLTAEDDPGTTTLEFYQPDGTTVVGTASNEGVVSTVAGTSGADELFAVSYTFGTPVTLTAGQRVLLALDIAANIGEVVGHIELAA